jgi:SAM-dependent methyltransferase
MNDNLERFSDRVGNYVKYRPSYPAGVLDLFRREMGLTGESVIADIGSGTGISARIFLENGNVVYGIEPNDAMRVAAEGYLSVYERFHSVKGTAEATGLLDDSVDLVVAAQAFHWFDRERARAEFLRILKPGGYVALIWNERQLNTTPFLTEYEQFLLKFANDYTKVRHENVDRESLKMFFQKDFETRVFSNAQVLDFDGVLGRVLSSSYMPNESSESFSEMREELKALVAKHAENGKIEILYDTAVHYSQF